MGDSLTGKIEEGLQANDYLGLVLSPAAVASEWVKAELSAAWCRQMSSRKIVVLPILYQDCEIPFLLEDRKYADFRTSYDEGFMALCAALGLKHSEALTVNECEEYVWREMEKFRATYGDPTGKSEHFMSCFLNDGQKLKIISEMLQKMDWYQGDMEDEKDEE